MRFEFKNHGDTITPTNADPLATLPAVLAFMRAMEAEAKATGEDLSFIGFETDIGSFAVETAPNNDALAKEAVRLVKEELLSGVSTKPHIRNLATAAAKSGFSILTVRSGRNAVKLDFSEIVPVQKSTISEVIECRAFCFSLSAKDESAETLVRLASVLSDETLVLKVPTDLEAAISKEFKREVDVMAEVERVTGSRELRGTLLSLVHVETEGDGLAAWRQWFKESGAAAAWSKVTPEQFEAEREGDWWPL